MSSPSEYIIIKGDRVIVLIVGPPRRGRHIEDIGVDVADILNRRRDSGRDLDGGKLMVHSREVLLIPLLGPHDDLRGYTNARKTPPAYEVKMRPFDLAGSDDRQIYLLWILLRHHPAVVDVEDRDQKAIGPPLSVLGLNGLVRR